MEGLFWIGVCIICLVIEAVTYSMVSIWFVMGAFLAFMAAFFGAEFMVQLIVFCAGSAITLACFRPAAKKLTRSGNGKERLRLNADRVIGKTAVVKKTIGKYNENLDGVGSVICSGMEWAAVAENETETFAPYTPVQVLRIEGVKLIVKKKLYNEMSPAEENGNPRCLEAAEPQRCFAIPAARKNNKKER